jgi:hypothetical protein
MRNEAKKFFFGFAKTSENDAKQDGFRFISLRSENYKKERKRETLLMVHSPHPFLPNKMAVSPGLHRGTQSTHSGMGSTTVYYNNIQYVIYSYRINVAN